jgi:hypothetical protein
LNLTPPVQERFFSALQAAGLPEVPGEFSVVAWHQVVPNAILAEIGKFIRAFDQVTARSAWQTAACRNVPAIAQLRRSEVCFFSAWDFHLPPDGGFKLIEFNDILDRHRLRPPFKVGSEACFEKSIMPNMNALGAVL